MSEDLVPELELLRDRGQREQRARVAHREPSAPEIGLNLLRKPQQPEAVRDRRAILPDSLGQLLLSPRELRQKLLIGLRRFDRVEILAQQVLDERELDALGVGGLSHDRGDPIEPGLARRAPPPLPRDELVRTSDSPNDDRLDDPRGLDRRRKLVERREVEDLSRLMRIDLDL